MSILFYFPSTPTPLIYQSQTSSVLIRNKLDLIQPVPTFGHKYFNATLLFLRAYPECFFFMLVINGEPFLVCSLGCD
ncbi:hypothetical protein BDB00DRAFT_799314 [Zychaea mexicana]|uniref:uncharacterized protein n=1 Tax=Zychaea mexicana TaxID=64656 RepID=UPI0022FE12DB|nr:uncharacterized protein BDB00DRAFT_799314 [Zychaea mexicana]KAI9498737.1 hypothetical protein BDB00DRAFT_799314 [Zychaea mexicana]